MGGKSEVQGLMGENLRFKGFLGENLKASNLTA